MLNRKRAFISMFIVFIYLFLTIQLHYLHIENETISHIRHLIKGFLDFIPLLIWFWFVKTRVIQPSVRRYLILGSLVMQFSLFVVYLQTIIVTEDINLMILSVLGIFVPYFIYPVFSLLATLCLGKPEQYKLPKIYLILPIISFIMGIIAFTNYYHEWFFKFEILPDDIHRSSVEPRWMCYVSIVFCLIVIIWRLVLTKGFADRSGSIKTFVLVLLSYISVIVYHIPYVLNSFASKWEFIGSTQYTFFIEILSWVICMSTGLVPVNTRYDMVYECSSMNFEIYDKEGKIVYPRTHTGISKDTFADLCEHKSLLSDENTVLHLSKLKKKGYVVWKKDISFINDLVLKQEQIKGELKEQKILLQNELTVKNAREKIQQKKAIYNKIDELLKVDICFLDSLVQKLLSSDEFDQKLYHDIILRGIYIKRKSNLLILNETSTYSPLSELKLTLDEMLTGLYDMQKDALYLVPLTKETETKDIISCLDLLARTVMEKELVSIHIRLEEECSETYFSILYDLSDESRHSSRMKLNIIDRQTKEAKA